MLDVYRDISERKRDGDDVSAFYTPYQITLPLLQALYFQFEKEDDNRKEEEIRKEILDGIRTGHLKAINPASRSSALKTSLRAIAYFSWEPESRVFLVRRVFPTYFDFFSVSHIPEGWGVSSIMLEALQRELENKKTPDVENGSFSKTVNVEDPDNRSRILPYLAEQKRLQYKHVLILPVFYPNPPKSDRDMLGTFLFFISADSGVLRKSSKEENQFRLFANDLCKATAELVVAGKLALAPDSLSAEWRKVREDQKTSVRIAEVKLSCDGHVHDGEICEELERAAREFLKALTIPNYYAIRDAEQPQSKDAAVFLVAAQHDVNLRDFKKRLLRIVTDQLSGRKVVCQVSIKVGGPATGGAFNLKADNEW